MKPITNFLKHGLGIIVLFAFTLNTKAQKEAVNIGDFVGIEVRGNLNVTLSQGKPALEIAGDSITRQMINAEVRNNVLLLEGAASEKGGRLFITHDRWDHIKVYGISDVTTADTLLSENMNILLTGAGDINLLINVDHLKTNISGAGDLKLEGNAAQHEGIVSGAGDLHAYDLKTQSSNVVVSGAGDARVNAKKELKAVVSGAGNIYYQEEPETKNIINSGVGNIQNTGEKTSLAEPDTTKMRFKKYHILIVENESDEDSTDKDIYTEKEDRNKHWAGLDLGVNGYLNPANSTSIPKPYDYMELNYAKSINFNFNFFEQDIRLADEYLKIVTGLGMEFNSYAFRNNTTLISGPDSVFAYRDTLVHFDKNKLKTSFITLPVLLAFNTSKNPDKAFHFATGVVFGYMIGSKTKQKFDLNGDTFNPKVRSDFHMLPYRASATVRMGYGNFSLYASYSLTSLFEPNEGPELYPFTLGCTLLAF